MNKSLRRRVAAVATTATVGGLLLPFLAAGSASAAPPTSLLPDKTAAVSSTDNTGTGNKTIFTGTFVGPTPVAGVGKVFAFATTGPDTNIANAAGSLCTFPGGVTNTYSCTFTNGVIAGTDTMVFSYDANGATVYNPANPSSATTPVTLTTTAPNKIAVSPVNGTGGANVYTGFTTTFTDTAGNPVPNSVINVTATEPSTDGGDLFVAGALPQNNLVGAATPNNNNTAVTGPFPVTTNAVGVASFSVASRNPGTVALKLASKFNPALGAPATLTVFAAIGDSVTAVVPSPATQRAPIATTVTTVVNVKDKSGKPVAAVTPAVIFQVGSTSFGAAILVGQSDVNGNALATYTAKNAVGQDTLQSYVNYFGGSGNLDQGEPSGTSVVNLVANDVNQITDNGGVGGFVVPLNTSATTITYTVANSNGATPLAGYNLVFTSSNILFTLSTPNAVTDASGRASVTVTNTGAPIANNDTSTVTASLGGLPLGAAGVGGKSDPVVVTYATPTVTSKTIYIAPFANTTTGQGTATFTASATDQFGNAFPGLFFDWVVNGRNSTASAASSPTFTYTDKGAVGTTGTDSVTVTVRNANQTFGTDVANQYWVAGTAATTQANIDLGDSANPANYNGTYTQSTPTNPVIASGFVKTANQPVTVDGTAIAPTKVQRVLVKLTDTVNNRLYGKPVTFSSAGVGVFTDANGKPIAGTSTALVADANVVTLYGATSYTADSATVFVRSTQGGTQTITATVDGISTTATVTYAGQFTGVTPVRVMDTRSGQGAVQVSGTTAPAGQLSPNTSYTFNYAANGIPLNQSAYAFNVTAVHPSGVGNLRVAPGNVTGTAPTTSLVNYRNGSDVANFVIVPNPVISAAGVVPVVYSNSLQLYSAASSSDVAIDFVGSYPSAGSVTATVPSRIADTRNGGTPIAVGETRSFQVAGLGGLPGTTAKAVALNVTVVNPTSLGNLRIFADGDAVPTTSNINYIPGQDKSAFVIVNLPASGKISVYSAGTAVDVAIDAYASFDKVTSNIVTQTPVRILDTRTGSPIAANGVRDLQVVGTAGVPATAQAVLVSITGIHTAGSLGSGNLGAFPTGGAVPIISTLNYVTPTSDVANFAIVKLGANGSITIDSMGSPTDVAVDVLGYVPAG